MRLFFLKMVCRKEDLDENVMNVKRQKEIQPILSKKHHMENASL